MKILRPDIPHGLKQTTTIASLLRGEEPLSGLDIMQADAAGVQTKGADIQECRITKTTFSQAKIEKLHMRDCVLDGCDLTAGSFPDSSWHAVKITNTRSSGIQLQMGNLKNVTFIDSPFEEVTFSDAVLKNVDISASPIVRIKGLRGLKGAHISPEQLMQLAPYFANEIGIIVKD